MWAVRHLAWRRCHGLCEVCGEPILMESVSPHHRLQVAHGGRLHAANILAVHTKCHNPIHRGLRSAEVRLGRLIEPDDARAPHEVPVRLWDGVWLLDDEGGRLLCSGYTMILPSGWERHSTAPETLSSMSSCGP